MALRGTTTGRHEYEFASHVGHVRKDNQDAAGACKDSGVVVVADGMGGHAEGAKASQTVVNEILEAVRKGKSLIAAVGSADAAIERYIHENPAADGMGTTVVAVKMNGCEYEIVWVGDSRAYFWHGGLKRLTQDHSLVQARINAGIISPEDEASQNDRNILERALMGKGIAEHEIGRVSGRLYRHEALILSTDGLHGMATDAEIAEVVKSGLNTDVSDALVALALEKGGDDNVTVAVLKPATDAEQRPREGATMEVPVVRIKKKPSNRLVYVVIAIALMLVAIFVGLRNRQSNTATGGGGALTQEAVTGEATTANEPDDSGLDLEERLQGKALSEDVPAQEDTDLIQDIATGEVTTSEDPGESGPGLEDHLKGRPIAEAMPAATDSDLIRDKVDGEVPANKKTNDSQPGLEDYLKGEVSTEEARKEDEGALIEGEKAPAKKELVDPEQVSGGKLQVKLSPDDLEAEAKSKVEDSID